MEASAHALTLIPPAPGAGLWDQKPVQCSSGDFLPGDYAGWKQWRDGLPTVEHI